MASKQQKLKDRALAYLQTAISSNTEMVDGYRKGLDAYMAKPYGNEVAGRSQVVMTDVSDAVEWIMPALMKVFIGGTDVVSFRPQGPEDENKAKLMEEKVNFDFQRCQNGYLVLHDWFKNALLGKFSVVKYWWETKDEPKYEHYQGLNIMQLAALQEEAEVVEVEEVQPGFFNAKLKRIVTYSYPRSMPVPPEEFVMDMANEDGIDENTEFCAHRKRVHKNYLKRYSLSSKDIEKELNADSDLTGVKESRFADLGGINFVTDDKEKHFVYIWECYLNDYGDKGEKKPMKVTIFGNRVLEAVENNYGKPPFCGLSTVRIPHRAAGRSMFDLVGDIQKLKTAMFRAVMDNIYYQNNGVKVVNPYRINMDDVIDHNEPGATWRTLYDVDPSTVLSPVEFTPINPQMLQIWELVESVKEKRSGITAYNQGLDSKTLNKTATGISQIMGAAQQRMEQIARHFAETGVKDLFQAYANMNIMFNDSVTNLKVNEQWQQVQPGDIDGKFDLTIDVGVGTGSKEVQVNQLINMINVSVPAIQMGIVQPENLYNLLRSIYEMMGYKNPDKYVSHPQNAPQQGGVPPEIQKALQDAQKTIQELQMKLMKAETKEEIEAAKIQIEKAKLMLQQQEMQMKYYAEKEKMKVASIHKIMDINMAQINASDNKSKGD